LIFLSLNCWGESPEGLTTGFIISGIGGDFFSHLVGNINILTGLSATAQLNKTGHWVTVFERADHPGGLLMYGVPNMKLDKEQVVLRHLKVLEDEGVKFICNTEVGKDFPAENL